MKILHLSSVHAQRTEFDAIEDFLIVWEIVFLATVDDAGSILLLIKIVAKLPKFSLFSSSRTIWAPSQFGENKRKKTNTPSLE